MTTRCDHSTVHHEPRKETASDDGASVIAESTIDPGLEVDASMLQEHLAPSPTVVLSEHQGLEVTMSELCSVHATFRPPKGVSSCSEDAPDEDEQPDPCGPTKPRLNGKPELCRKVWDEFCAKQDPHDFKMDADLAAISASLAEDALPPIARAALEEQLGLAPGSLTNGSVQIVRVRARRMEAEVVVLDPVQRRMRSAYVRLIGPSELEELAHVLNLLKTWEPVAKGRARRVD